MRTRITVLLLSGVTLSAQYSDFAVTYDGRLYFSTQLVTGADQDSRYKVYNYTSERLTLVAMGTGTSTSGRSAIMPFTSGDGSVTGYALNYPCLPGSCGLPGLPHTLFELQDAGGLTDLPYSIGFRVIELPGQVTHDLSQSFDPAGRQVIAHNVSVLVRDPRHLSLPLMLVPLGKDPVAVAGTGTAFNALLSPDGTHIAFDRRTASTYDLILTDAQGSNPRVLSSVPLNLPAPRPVSVFRNQPSFANDGTLLDEVIPETAFAAPDFPSALPGSVATGLTANTKFLLGEDPIPLSDLTAGGAVVQLPGEYDVKNGPRILKIQGPASPFFQQTAFFPIGQPYVMFEHTNFGKTLQIAHQAADPAVAGETIHVFPRNMGPVDKPVQTGQGAPADPQPARITSPLACYLFNDTKATGAIGVYHIDVTIPANRDSSNPKLSCQIQGADGTLRGDFAAISVHPGSR